MTTILIIIGLTLIASAVTFVAIVKNEREKAKREAESRWPWEDHV